MRTLASEWRLTRYEDAKDITSLLLCPQYDAGSRCEVFIVPQTIFGLFWVCVYSTLYFHVLLSVEHTLHTYALKILSV